MRRRRPIEIGKICRALEREYRSPRHGNKANPLDELVYIILSTRTHDRSFRRIYRELKGNFGSWNNIGAKDRSTVERILRPGGLSALKADQIVGILDKIRRRAGSTTLSSLRGLPTERVEEFLTSLPGVSKKVAKCVAMYSLGRPVLPVDVHVHRVSSRVGLSVKKRPDTSQDLIEAAVPPKMRYGFHVNAVAHGRSTCLPRNPSCISCCIRSFCQSFSVGHINVT
jgi:endonuclease III